MSDVEIQQLIRAGRLQDARLLAEKAVAGSAESNLPHALLAHLLLQMNELGEARSVVTSAARLNGSNAAALDGLAYVATALDLHDLANRLYTRATQAAPRTARYWHNLANSERSFGRLDTAEAACNNALALDAKHYPSVLLRSEMRPQTPAANHIEELARRLSNPSLDTDGRIFLGYALAKELDDVQRFDEAFRRFAAAARLRRTQFKYDVRRDETLLARIACAFDGACSPSSQRAIPASCVFIVGLPRTGTTLVERILTGLRGVRSNGETHNFSRALNLAASPDCADPIERAARADPARVAAAYRQLAGIGGHETVIDKLPTNALYIGAIRRALPDAKIVLLERVPLDACFAMYRNLFGDAYPFSYDFDELARYVAAYMRLMDHWRRYTGTALLEVSYEELVARPEAVAPWIAAHCGLEWNSDALQIQNNRSVSLTASASQARRPIYGTSSGRWRHYRQPLQPLIDALRRNGVPTPPDA